MDCHSVSEERHAMYGGGGGLASMADGAYGDAQALDTIGCVKTTTHDPHAPGAWCGHVSGARRHHSALLTDIQVPVT